MKRPLKCVILSFLLFAHVISSRAQVNYPNIKDYKVFYASAKRNSIDWFALRKFQESGKTYLLLVNPDDLETKVDEAELYAISPMSMAKARIYYQTSSYAKALRIAEMKPKSIQRAGIQRGIPSQTGVTLTADLCPSTRPLDKRVFTTIAEQFKKAAQPAPIALSVSGVWIRQHPQDLAWLKEMNLKNEIHITWINHSYNHRVSKTLPLKENFLLVRGTDIDYEVLETEKAMLKNGLLPSVFFRFPGLVANEPLVHKITDFGLIPIGSDAWLAKGQKPHAGSIVLIHANGNEPIGVDDFLKLLRSKTKAITKKQWLLFDLSTTVKETAEKTN